MTLPPVVRGVLPPDTATTWKRIAAVLPSSAYLSGGTALAIHLQHRMSRDLDFFLERPVDLRQLRDRLAELGPLHVDRFDDRQGGQTLNAVFSATKVQFLEASTLVVLEPLHQIAGVRVASIGDLLATKLKVILDRPELRDYYDLLVIERDARRHAEEGLALAVRKYRPEAPDGFVASVLRGLASFGDVEDDPGVPMPRDEIARYWIARVPEIVANLER